METLNFRRSPRRDETVAVQIEPAYKCDGSLCHQPIFREDGSLNIVSPHCHLVERNANGARYYAVLCDFPAAGELQKRVLQSAHEFGPPESLFANYPPFAKED